MLFSLRWGATDLDEDVPLTKQAQPLTCPHLILSSGFILVPLARDGTLREGWQGSLNHLLPWDFQTPIMILLCVLPSPHGGGK